MPLSPKLVRRKLYEIITGKQGNQILSERKFILHDFELLDLSAKNNANRNKYCSDLHCIILMLPDFY